jgi:hypothetical protein
MAISQPMDERQESPAFYKLSVPAITLGVMAYPLVPVSFNPRNSAALVRLELNL